MFIRSLILAVTLSPLAFAAEKPVTKLACGSCYKPEKDKGIWKVIAKENPEAFLFMGDCIYGDTDDMTVLKAKFGKLLTHPDYAAFSKTVPILATWDDHDYGLNDAGREYAKRAESQKVFQDTFGFPADHPARKTEGVYHSRMMGPDGQRTQVILLDTRYFRSGMVQERINGRNNYVPQTGPDATMLGDVQWTWLAGELKKSADLRIIVSSIQVLATHHRFEKWANMPDEKNRLLQLLKSTKSGPTILLSGDRHLAEVFKMPSSESGLPFDLYEMTTSGLTHAGASNDPSPYRVAGTYTRELNYGVLEIAWKGTQPAVTLCVKDSNGKSLSATKVDF